MSMKLLESQVFIDPTMDFVRLYLRISNAMRKALGREYRCAHDAAEIISLAWASEEWAENHGIRPEDRTGLQVVDGSVKSPSLSSRTATAVCLERQPKGWYLIGVRTVEVGPDQILSTRFFLTPEQDALVKKWRERKYCVRDDTERMGDVSVAKSEPMRHTIMR